MTRRGLRMAAIWVPGLRGSTNWQKVLGSRPLLPGRTPYHRGVHRHRPIVMLLLFEACAGQPYLPDAPPASEIAGTVTGCSAAAGAATSSVIMAAELQQTRAA